MKCKAGKAYFEYAAYLNWVVFMTQFVKSDTLRKFGVDFVGDVPWGTHR
jgi:hypothetical protein